MKLSSTRSSSVEIFGVAQADVVGEEDFRHVGEQEGAVDGGDFDGVPVGVVFFGG